MNLVPKRPGRGDLGWFSLSACLLGALAGGGPVHASEPTDLEQYMIELVNAARAAPAAEAARLGIDLNEGLSPGALGAEARPPLAFDPRLADAAAGHTAWMLAADVFDHIGAGGSTAWGRQTDAGYDWQTMGENIAWRGTSGTLTPYMVESFVGRLHEQLFVSPGHRENLLRHELREIGVGLMEGVFTTYRDWNTVMVTQSMGRESNDRFLTGVVFEDLDEDGFYSPGEGEGGVMIAVVSETAGVVYQTITWEAGGYSIALPPDTYSVVAWGGELDYLGLVDAVVIGGENVKVDFQPPEPEVAAHGNALAVPEPAALVQLVAGVGLLLRLPRRGRLRSHERDPRARGSVGR